MDSTYTWNDFTWNDATAFAGKYQLYATAILVAYVPAVFLLRRVSPTVQGIDSWLCAWNTLASALSFAGFVALAPVLWQTGTQFSLDYLSGPSGLVMFLFNLSKLPELVDTVFIVLRRRPLTFLHVFHHWLTAVYCWSTFYYPPALGLWYATMNLFVHGIMYAYFAVKFWGIEIVPPVLITSIQVCQMLAGFGLNLALVASGPEPTFSVVYNATFGLVMYGCYVALFGSFFVRRYLRGDSRSERAFRSRLYQARMANGWTHKELARRVGMPAQMIQGYESGASMPPSNMVTRLGRILGKSLE